jgi:hypothetical protein
LVPSGRIAMVELPWSAFFERPSHFIDETTRKELASA